MKKSKVEKKLNHELDNVRRIGDEFKEFIARGNVVDLAVGVIVGGAFGAITTSLVNDVVMPFIGVLIGGFDFSALAITVGEARIGYGAFIQAVLNFLIIAVCIFIFVKLINSIQSAAKAKKTEVEDKAVKKKEDEQLEILKQIRDELKRR